MRDSLNAIMGLGIIVGLGSGSGYLVARWNGGQQCVAEVRALWDLPAGEFYPTSEPRAVWQKTGPRTLAYRPIADPATARAVRMFTPESAPPISTTTTAASTTTTSTTAAARRPRGGGR